MAKPLPQDDTIAAIATPVGVGGVGIVRVSGPGAAGVLARVVGVEREALRERLLVRGSARDAAGEVLDDVLFVWMPGPRSFTGEDVAEIHGHGGPANMGRLLRAILAAGARPAEAGEFTRRAFENGRLDLTRAEAIADVATAASERALRSAQAQLRGALGAEIDGVRDDARRALAEVEAAIDFPDEGLEAGSADELGAALEAAVQRCRALAGSFGLGGALREGIEVALRGPVNAGKSSLLNRLVGDERALVDAAPGTTRDVVEVRALWDGVPVTLLDTAGEREAPSDVERRGIELGRRRCAQADVEILLVPVDASGEVAAPAHDRQIVVLSKCDLAREDAPAGAVATSAVTGEGLEALRAAVLERATGGAAEAGSDVVVTSERQRRLLVEAADALDEARRRLREEAPLEVVAIDLRVGVEALAEILGETVGEDVLDELFSRFCIGK